MAQEKLIQFLSIVALTLGSCSSTTAAQGASETSAAPSSCSDRPLAGSAQSRLETVLPLLAQRIMEEEKIPGAAIVVVQNGRTIFRQGFGVEDIRETRTVDVDQTIFRIGSISKPMTMWAIARLVDLGAVSYDDPVAKFVPEIEEVPNLSGSSHPILIRHVLTHTGGLDQVGVGRHIHDYEQPFEDRLKQRPRIETFLLDGNLRRTSPAGTHYRYETYGTVLAGLILERITGKPYGEAMKEVLFKPAGMQRATVLARAENQKRLSVGHGYMEDQNAYGITPTEIYVTQPASSIDMTPADMERLMKVVTDPDNPAFDPFLSSTMRRSLLSSQFQPHPGFAGVTHGMQEFARAGGRDAALVRAIGHGGTMWGFQSSIMFLPDYGIGVFVTANRNAEGGGGQVTLDRQVNALIAQLVAPKAATTFRAVEPESGVDLSRYTGTYAYGVFCQTCTSEEFANGAWQASSFLNVVEVGDHLHVRGTKYFSIGGDVFLAEDRSNKLHFNFGSGDLAQYVSFATSPDTFERFEEREALEIE